MAQTTALPPVRFPQTGGCLCGNTRYQLVTDPLTVYACHCLDCQRMTGSSFFLSMFVDKNAIQFEGAEPSRRAFLLEDGREREGFACDNCSTWLWAEPKGLAELLLLWTGTLDDTSWIRPVGHIFTRSAQSWVTIPTGDLQFETGPDSLEPFFRAWSSRLDTPSSSSQ